MKKFEASELKRIYKPDKNSSGEDNGQIVIIGGSVLFHGPPFFSIKAASRVVDMVYFASPYKPMRDAAVNLKARVGSFIWIPFNEVEEYIKKSDAILIGPGFMRAHTEKANGKPSNFADQAFRLSRTITERLLNKFPDKKWVVDAGSLQVIEPEFLPKDAIITPNKKEYKMLFGGLSPEAAARKYHCIIVLKGPITYVYSPKESLAIRGGNAGMTKGGTGDAMAGLTVALLAKNEPLLAACAGAFVIKATGDALYKKQGVYFNADDLADEIPKTLFKLL